MNLPLDKFKLITASIQRRLESERSIMVTDTAAAIAGVFGEKGNLEEYLRTLKEK